MGGGATNSPSLSCFINPFLTNATALVNISTGAHASPEVCQDLTHVKEMGTRALMSALGSTNKVQPVKLHTFDSVKKKLGPSTDEKRQSQLEVMLLQRITKIIANGGSVDMNDVIGQHECSDTPPALFEASGNLRSGTKSTLVPILLSETHVSPSAQLPDDQSPTAIIVDAMYQIHKWSFMQRETFSQVQKRYKDSLLVDVTPHTTSIHFCCDRYDVTPSLKSQKRASRTAGKTSQVYEVRGNVTAPVFKDFITCPENKMNLQQFLLESWCHDPFFSDQQLYLSGGFKDPTETCCLSNYTLQTVPELACTHEEADNRIIVHMLYCAKELKSPRIVIHANDTDIIVSSIYYCNKFRQMFQELWVRTDPTVYLPIHEIVDNLGYSTCLFLPFFHAISGKDDTSFMYGKGKKKMWNAQKAISHRELERFGEEPAFGAKLTDEQISEARDLVVVAYGGQQGTSLAEMRVQKYICGSTGQLHYLPPTEAAFQQHLARVSLSTIIAKSAHVPQVPEPEFEQYGWKVLADGALAPVKSASSAFPGNLQKSTKCGCKKGCKNRCSCAKNGLPCCIVCVCGGKSDKCTRAILNDVGDDDDDYDDNEDNAHDDVHDNVND